MQIGAARAEDMTDAQRAVYDGIAGGPRGGVPLPFFAMLDSPALCNAIQLVGETIRYRTTMSDRLREIAILSVAAAVGSGYEWSYHDALAVKAGLTPVERASVLNGSGAGLQAGEGSLVRYTFTAIREHRADRRLLAELTATFGREAATEVTAIAGYYQLLALYLSAGDLDTPLPSTIT